MKVLNFVTDKFGRKWTHTISLGLIAVLGTCLAYAPSFPALIVLRILIMIPVIVSTVYVTSAINRELVGSYIFKI